MSGVSDIIVALQALLPPWAIALVVVAVAAVAVPGWLFSVRVKRMKGRVRRLLRADPQTRATLVEECFEIAGDRPALLEALAAEALKMGHPDVRNRALELLESKGGGKEAAVIRQKFEKEKKAAVHPLQAIVVIERLMDEGMEDTARQRLAEALERFPKDPELLEIQQRLGS